MYLLKHIKERRQLLLKVEQIQPEEEEKLAKVAANIVTVEQCIRHIDGSPVKSDGEKKRVIQCLEAAIQQRLTEAIQENSMCREL
nr:hypothetical protein [Tanacetum cinerariifolium]